MRRSAQRKLQDTTMYLPGFEPEEVLASQQVVHVQAEGAKNPLFTVVNEPFEVQTKVVPTVETYSLEPLAESPADDISSGVGFAFDPGEESGLVRKNWARFDIEAIVPPSGELERVMHNIHVLELVKQLKDEGRHPSPAESHDILRYTGWGSIARIFEDGLQGKSLGEHQSKLRSILTEDEWASARASTPNAHYTDPSFIKSIWAMVERMGFKGGNILEPAAGTGLFIAGMPEHIARNSSISAVEIDTVSGSLLNEVFAPLGVNVQIAGLEKAKMPKGMFDLVIGNVPFGAIKVPDVSKQYFSDWTIHNWFFGKSLELARPGGLVVFITSSFTMDGADTVRKWLAVHADLITAVRLPKGAFQRQAKTEVVADIVVLRKRMKPQFGASEVWTRDLVTAPKEMIAEGQDLHYYNRGHRLEKPRDINPWFAKNPTQVLGKLVFATNRFGKDVIEPIQQGSDEEFRQHLHALLNEVPQDAYKEPVRKEEIPQSFRVEKVRALHDTKPGQFVLHNNRIAISEGDEWVDVDAVYQGKVRDRVLGLMGIRDAARAVIECQIRTEDDNELCGLRAVLNERYDRFVRALGPINYSMNVRTFKSDPDFPLLLGLEVFDEETQIATKADIFRMRTVNHRALPDHAESVKDALLITLARCGTVNLRQIALMVRKTVDEVANELLEQKLAFKDPVSKAWLMADEYLSGHIRHKIEVAKAAGSGFEVNLEALNSCLPQPLGPGEIEVRIGAPWIPATVIRDFAVHLMEVHAERVKDVKISYASDGAVWSVNGDSSGAMHALRSIKWGTQHRDFFSLLEAALNQTPPTITRKVDGQQVTDKTATLQARERYEGIKEAFKRWVHDDEARSALLVGLYNDKFNQIVPRKWNGMHLHLPGMRASFTAYPSQLNAIWRAVVDGGMLLAHAVGAGKSFTMQAIAMERRRLGLSKKPLHVVPNHMLLQYCGEFARDFPTAKLLMADKDSLHGDNRRRLIARIAMGDWDSIVITQSTFERLSTRPEVMSEFVDQMLGKARLALSSAQDSGAKRSIKELEKRLKNLEARLEKMSDRPQNDDMLYFEDLGTDFLLYDEAHLAKNLFRVSKLPRVAGLPNSASFRAFDLLVKTRTLAAMLGDEESGAVLATATPLANSIAEMHVFQRFLQPRTLEEMGIAEFDAWAATFGESVTGLEIAPDGSGYRMNTRFSKFVNVPELMAIFRMKADIQTEQMLNLPRPSIKGGKPQVVECSASPELKAFTQELVKRADLVRSGAVKPNEDNMLKITHQGRLAATDMRLIDPSMPATVGGKLQKVLDNVLRIYNETAERKGTQLIFCDIGTPKAYAFSVYTQLRLDLIGAGIPAGEIEFVHDWNSDAKKAKLFKLVREGVVRVLLGSTQKMGVGTNVQALLKAVHQVDVPWRPVDVIQRDGRGARVGNSWDEIELLRYATVQSFDAYMWQGNEIKMRFIEQIMSGDSSVRTVEDISISALSFAEIKAIASGNPVVLEKATVDAEVMKLATLRDMWENERWQARNQLRDANATLAHCAKQREMAPEVEVRALEALNSRFQPAKGAIAEAAQGLPDRESQIGAAVRRASALSHQFGDIRLGALGAFELNFRRSLQGYLELRLEQADIHHQMDVKVSQVVETGSRVIAFIQDFTKFSSQLSAVEANMHARITTCRAIADSEFEHAARLKELYLRQAAINAELDLDKDMAGTQTMDAEEATRESTETEEVVEVL